MTEDEFRQIVKGSGLPASKMAAIIAECSADDGVTDETLMWFGKWRGRPMSKVPPGYLLWLADEMGRDPDDPRKKSLRAYIDTNRAALESEEQEYQSRRKSN